ncbi:MAG TPA: UPF0149 family protein [Rhizomicrobium sp.]|jgi:uncharacterized protein|nr:UPF0149 family protein [Rhizomicrobium sp.]
MKDTEIPVDEINLDFLDDFLLSDRVPEDAMTLPELDGFLAGIAVGPEPIEPEEWLPLVWGDESGPDFADEAQMAAVLGAIVGLYNDVVSQIVERTYIPILWTDDDGAPLPEGWVHAFFEAAGLRLDAWRPLLESERDGIVLVPLFAFCADDQGPVLPDMTAKERETIRLNASDMIADAVLVVADYWARAAQGLDPLPRDPVRVAATPGRNDPCACGSGLKYKKCCGKPT